MGNPGFMGTIAWYFFLINLTKVPIYAAQGLFTGQSLLINLYMAPIIILGVFLGRSAAAALLRPHLRPGHHYSRRPRRAQPDREIARPGSRLGKELKPVSPRPADLPELTSGEGSYARELHLACPAPDRHRAVWIAQEGEEESVQVWEIAGAQTRRVGAIAPVAGAPARPRTCGDRVWWLEYADARGRLWSAEICDGGLGQPQAVAEANCGDYACCQDAAGRPWALAQVWRPEGVGLRLWGPEGVARDYLGADATGEFCARPQLCAVGAGMWAAWDEFLEGRYRVMVAEISTDYSRPLPLPAPPSTWESLPALACTGEGTLYVARGRERLVELPEGLASHHSQLVVSCRPPGAEAWREVAAVDIDHAMNPWRAAYMGWRRYAHLVPGADGVWLLWEEKEDESSMDPPLGRLCRRWVQADGVAGREEIALAGRSGLVLAEGGAPAALLVASKTQFAPRAQHLPYALHRLDLTAAAAPRPEGLVSQAAAPDFPVRPLPERARLDGADLTLYFGDPHLHSRLSHDLDGEPDEVYHFARERAGLDFAAVTENDFHWFGEPLSAAAWEQNRRSAEHFNQPGRFTALLGWEYTALRPNPRPGEMSDTHRSVLFPGGEGAVYSWHEGRTPTPAALVERFRGQRVLLHHHHPSGYDLTDDALERNIEVCSGWWNCMLIPDFVERLHGLLRRGFRLGFLGASDNHERNPGLGGALTGVWASANTREGIFEALWARRIFATTGLRPDLRCWVAGACMGSETVTEAPPEIRIEVRCETPVRRIELLRDGVVVHASAHDDTEVLLTWRDEACTPGEHFYCAHVLFAGTEADLYWNIATAYGVHAWTSPVWVTVR
jgi:hypothetical protein